jgi:hypothetical protein
MTKPLVVTMHLQMFLCRDRDRDRYRHDPEVERGGCVFNGFRAPVKDPVSGKRLVNAMTPQFPAFSLRPLLTVHNLQRNQNNTQENSRVRD